MRASGKRQQLIEREASSLIYMNEAWYKALVFLVLLALSVGIIALVFGSIYMASSPVEKQGNSIYTNTSIGQQITGNVRFNQFACDASTTYTVSVCSLFCGTQNTTVNCNTTSPCASTSSGGCYVTTPCDLSSWIGNDLIFAGSQVGTTNVLEVAPTYADCPTRIIYGTTPYRSMIVTDLASVHLVVIGPNALSVISPVFPGITFL